MKIGIMSDSLRLGVRGGVRRAAQLGAQGVQIYAVSGEMAPENLNAAARKDLAHYIEDCGLVVSALCGDLGGHGFAVEKDNPGKIEKSKRIMDLALDLNCRVVTTHIGVVPQDKAHPRYAVMAEACRELGQYGDQVGCRFALETGAETAQALKAFLDDLGCKGMCVNLDPANLVMVMGDDPVQAVRTLAPYIVHTHAKDGRMLIKGDPERIYGYFAESGVEDLRMEDYFQEVPLGQGQVDWPNYLAALREIGYEGFLTIEREVGEDPDRDIAQAVQFLKRML